MLAKGYKLAVRRQISAGDLRYSMLTTVHTTELLTSKLPGEHSFNVLTITTMMWRLCEVVDVVTNLTL